MEIAEDSKLKISMGALFVALGVFAGFVGWMTNIDAKASEVATVSDTIKSIDKRLSRIEILLEDLLTNKQ